jgi:hypothetical protein
VLQRLNDIDTDGGAGGPELWVVDQRLNALEAVDPLALQLIPMFPESVVDASPSVGIGAGRGEKLRGNIFDKPSDPTNPGTDGNSIYIAPHGGGVVYTVMDMGTPRRVTVLEVYGATAATYLPTVLQNFPARIAVLHAASASGPWTPITEHYNATAPTEFGYARIQLPDDGILTRYLRLEMSEPVTGTMPTIGIAEVLLFERFSNLSANIASLNRSIETMADTAFVMDALALKADRVPGSREYPPSAMTGDTMALSGFGYGDGTYVASASSTFSSLTPFNAFDRSSGPWVSAVAYENLGLTVLGGYTGSTTTTVADVEYAGEWLQLQLPTAVFADEVHLMHNIVVFPGSLVIAGSNNGATWSLISSHLDMPPWERDQKLVTGVTTAYTHLRLIVLKMYNKTQATIHDARIIEYERPVFQAQLAEVQTDIAALLAQKADTSFVTDALALMDSSMNQELTALEARLKPGVVLPITGANIVSATAGIFERPAANLFDSPQDPFFDGTDGDSKYIVGFSQPGEVIPNLDSPTQLTEFIFYHVLAFIWWFPRNWVISSGDAPTGPWTEQATENLPGDEPTSPIALSIPVDFTAQYVRINFSTPFTSGSHLNINECIIKGIVPPVFQAQLAEVQTDIAALQTSKADNTILLPAIEYPPTMTQNTQALTGGTYTASASATWPSFEPKNAFDASQSSINNLAFTPAIQWNDGCAHSQCCYNTGRRCQCQRRVAAADNADRRHDLECCHSAHQLSRRTETLAT